MSLEERPFVRKIVRLSQRFSLELNIRKTQALDEGVLEVDIGG